MRRPKPTAPKAHISARMGAAEREALADGAVYAGSPYHKDSPNDFGAFRPRPGAVTADQALNSDSEPDCTICPRKWARRRKAATALLQEAIRQGLLSDDAGPGRLPSRVWARDPDQPDLVYQARRQPGGTYYAYPLTRAQAAKVPVRFP